MAMNFIVGNTEHIVVPNAASLNPSSQISLSAWVNPNAGATRSMIRKSAAVAQFIQYQLRLQNISGTALSVRLGLADVNFTTTSLVNLGVWNFIVGTYDGTDLRVYFDGVFDSLLNSPGLTMIDNGAGVGLGASDTGVLPMDGDMDDLRIWDRALSADEILSMFTLRGQDPNRHGLISRWTMAEREPGIAASGVGSIKDLGPNGNDGNPTNTPTYAEGILSFGRRAS